MKNLLVAAFFMSFIFSCRVIIENDESTEKKPVDSKDPAPETPTDPAPETPTDPAPETPTDPAPACDDEVVFNFDSHDNTYWYRSDNYNNGTELFMVGWREDNIKFEGGIMSLILDNVNCPSDCSSKNVAAGNYQTLNRYKYGWYEARFKTSGVTGTVTSLFTYTGPSDGNQWDEIDIEIVGASPEKMQINYWTNGQEHPKDIELGFDSSKDFHTYAFEWRKDYIKWYVDGKLIHIETGSRGALPTVYLMKLMMNYWAAKGWEKTGVFVYNEPSKAEYDYYKFKPESCLD